MMSIVMENQSRKETLCGTTRKLSQEERQRNSGDPGRDHGE